MVGWLASWLVGWLAGCSLATPWQLKQKLPNCVTVVKNAARQLTKVSFPSTKAVRTPTDESVWGKIIILLHTFKNYLFGRSEIDTPIRDPKSGGRFVERIRRSSRESLILVVKNAGEPSADTSMGLLKTARTPTAAALFGEIDLL